MRGKSQKIRNTEGDTIKTCPKALADPSSAHT